ncbi:MAG: alpha/beta hydrolase [Bacteroidales bacterium]|nr:alpha/beta hydrolase [Candidatus Cryptobacteroides caccocaballi]
MKRFLLSLALMAASVAMLAQAPAQRAPQQRRGGFSFGPRVDTVKIWPNGAPNAFESPAGSRYTEAYMEVYPARNPNGYCVIACPGGGYAMLSDTHEGRDFKDWFNAHGYTFCLLEYRLPRGHHDVPLSDVQEAIKIMRGRKDLGIEHVGVMGCSAGGHLASTAATHFTSDENRPEFQILFYPVTTMDLSYTHRGSYDGLLGENPSKELVDLYSNDKHVTPNTPPALILLSSDDFLVPVANSLRYYEALVANKVSASMHIYPTGGHGWGWSERVFKREFVGEMERWLNTEVRKIE